MKIYMYFPGEDVHQDLNPYVYTLVDTVADMHKEVEFAYNEHIFWQDDILAYDIVHIMWPDSLLIWGQEKHTIDDLISQLDKIKINGGKIVCTCHNLQTHYVEYPLAIQAYNIVYRYADVFVHLEEYSKNELSAKYPSAKHVVIPHHTYDTIYTTFPTREEAYELLKFKPGQYALCLGSFRNNDEKKLFLRIAKELRRYNYKCIAPSFILDIPHGKIDKRWFKQRIKSLLMRFLYPNVIINLGYISNDLIPYFYALSNISIIQRIKILNSGNVPLGMYFGNVIIGPNVGNVKEILCKTGNPIFDVNDLNTIKDACREAVAASKRDLGLQNREYAIQNWQTREVAEQLYQEYKMCMQNMQ